MGRIDEKQMLNDLQSIIEHIYLIASEYYAEIGKLSIKIENLTANNMKLEQDKKQSDQVVKEFRYKIDFTNWRFEKSAGQIKRFGNNFTEK